MTYKNDPAFPFVETNNQTENVSEGISKREYFAASALQGMLAYNHRPDMNGFAEIALDAVVAADYLIDALNKK